MFRITKIIKHKDWEEFKIKGVLSEDSLINEGFIHCSFFNQSIEVANKYFKNESEVLLLILNPELITEEIKYEKASNGQEYPHIYGPLNIGSVIEIVPFVKSAEGFFNLPNEISTGYKF
ncbi:DUF952 domain-containing protein [Bacillus sp. BRMEA1]|uniref:DUF952 domain-containing protein n=1 Tax=Neobacillus endophyticus TaxID=2738405 RepID=UPI0015646048|nr:DUF952 domain-containing protein [Neobacillus endophyticus]NRD77758.1 DUF952 domain-containing protein [Neobacillus endophyticus]